MRVSDLQSSPINILIYGPPGTGKTALALTLGEAAEVMDMDGNLEVAFGLKDNLKDKRLKVHMNQYLDTNHLTAVAYSKAKARLLSIAESCRRGTYKRKAYILDSLSALDTAAKYHVMSNSGEMTAAPQIQHWGVILSEIENFIHVIKSLPIPTIIVAHETQFTSTDVSKVQIAVSGQKLPGRITRMFSEIWYTRIRPKGGGISELYLQTVPTSSITCRSGRGLTTGLTYGTIKKDGTPGESMGMWDIMKKLGYELPKEGDQNDNIEVKVPAPTEAT